MFTTTFCLTDSKFENGPLGHIDFDGVLWACRVAQQKFLESLGLDIPALQFKGFWFLLKQIHSTSFGKELFFGDNVSAEISLEIQKRFYLEFHVVITKDDNMACDAKFMMVPAGSKGPLRLPKSIEEALTA